ncbi:hypothetical protein C1646_757601 [Rhizophagus diaphanus]|nr:hypothetical protein C1646_757601 [Rhizophagus diaphanus] [Rhizophagus sp. MUCL 43196]
MKYAELSYLVENITVFVSCLGKITISKINKIGHNYAASLFHKYRRVQFVFYQYVDKNSFLITIYQNSQIVAEYIDISSNTVWKKTGVLTSILELYSHKLPNECTLADWNNEIIIKHLYELYLKRNIRQSVEWQFQERKLRAWYIMLYTTGCTNITLYNKNISCEFWTNASEPEKDCEIIAKLYAEGLLYVTLPTLALWNCFCNSYNTNSKGIDDKAHILSIIAEKFTYKEIIEELKVSPNSVNVA